MKELPRLTESDIKRLWKNIHKRGEDDCWPWRLSLQNSGYPQIVIQGWTYLVIRVVAMLEIGDPTGYDVCHTCDYKPCCNPKHLFIGTRQQNMQDASQKGILAVRQRPSGLSQEEISRIKYLANFYDAEEIAEMDQFKGRISPFGIRHIGGGVRRRLR